MSGRSEAEEAVRVEAYETVARGPAASGAGTGRVTFEGSSLN